MKPTSFGLLPAETEVLVLGADLAGAVAASRLARAGKRVVVLERRTAAEHPGVEPGGKVDGHGAVLEPPPGLFEDPRWPAGLRRDGNKEAGGVAAALAEVRVEASALAGGPAETTAPGGSPAHRLAERHLAVAAAHGARLFLGVEARSLELAGAGWLVKLEIPGLGRERFDAPAMFVAAGAVVLSGGAWAGELLAAAHQQGLSLAPLLGVSRSAVMGETAATAAVDHLGRVFQADGKTQAGLIVVGEASAPMALRPLPGLASAALALRATDALLASDALLAQPGGAGGAAVASQPPAVVAADGEPPDTVGMRFTEAMRGFFSTQVTNPDYARGASQGREDGSSLAFVVTVVADDLATLVDAPEHRGLLLGTVVAPALSPRPMMVNQGEFDLFGDPSPAHTAEGYDRDRTGLQPRRERHMRYRMPVRAADGQRFFLSGYKVIRDDRGFDVWADTTTLMVTVHAGDDAKASVIGRGVLRIYAEDLKRQVKTMEVTGTRSARQRLRAQLAFARVFGGTLFDAYLGEQHLVPSAGVRRGPLRVMLAAAAKALGILLFVGLFLWPWRPAFLRQEPPIAADPADPAQGGPNEPDGPVGRNLPPAVAALGLFPQYLRGRDLRGGLRIERQDLRADWREDNIVTDHGGLADLPVRPPDITKLTDGPLRRGYMNLARIRDGGGQVVGIGSQVETASWDSRPWRGLINAHTTWSVVLPGRGLLFLSQKEGGDDIGGTAAAAKQAGQTWRGNEKFNHTLGPLSDRRGIIHGGSGEFASIVGSFREWNSLFEVPVQGVIHGATDFELHFLWTRRDADADGRVRARLPAEVAALRLPPAALERLHPARPWKLFSRRFGLDLPGDIVYRTHGPGGQGPVVPASLGPLTDPALAPVTILMAKLRDERGDVVGQAGAARIDGPAGPARVDEPAGAQLPGAAQWTLLLPGEGSIFVSLPDDQLSLMGPGERPADGATRCFGGGRGVVVGGTGLYANAAGVMTERWRPASPGQAGGEGVGSIQLDMELVLDR